MRITELPKIGFKRQDYQSSITPGVKRDNLPIEHRSFGPLRPAKGILQKEERLALEKFAKNFLEKEKLLSDYMKKIQSGNSLDMKDLIVVQELMLGNMRQIELFMRMFQSLTTTLKTLQQQGI
ncbi:MAG: hypothetical protein JXR95_10830 [Deltaproteobacteria bacterium]|nr:hypothetical protein [Deltaproteobacteria bacterium]